MTARKIITRAEGIYQRGANPKKLTLKIYVGRDPVTGKPNVKWHPFKGTLNKAKAERGRLISEIEAGTYVEPSRLTVAKYLKGWLTDHARHNVSPKTFERYQEIVEKNLIPALGAHRLVKLAPVHIKAYHGEALASGRLHPGKGENAARGLSAQTVKHHHRVLSQALREAVLLQLLTRNPCEAVKPPRPVQREMNVLDQEATARLLREVEHLAIHMPILLAVTTGMRRGEILGLRWKDINLDAATLSVCQTLWFPHAACQIVYSLQDSRL